MHLILGSDLASIPSCIGDVETVGSNGEIHADNGSTIVVNQNSGGDDSSDSGSLFNSGRKVKGKSGKNQIQDALLELLMKKMELEEEDKENRKTIYKEAAEWETKFLSITEKLTNSICENSK